MAIVLKDLQKLVSQQQKENTRKELFQRLQGKPFWIWNVEEHKQAAALIISLDYQIKIELINLFMTVRE